MFMKTFYLLLSLIFYASGIFSQEIVINEFCASNNSLISDSNGEYSDWIELFNKSNLDINLENYSLSDDETEPRKWLFPNIIIPVNGYILVFASGENLTIGNELHTNFKIKESGETLILSDHLSNTIDISTPINLTSDHSYARISDGNTNWKISNKPTPGTSNIFFGDIISSHPSGFYDEKFLLTLTASNPNQKIYFTLNGSLPTTKSLLYTQPILIDERPDDDFSFSSIPTTPLAGNPVLDNFIWKAPKQVQTTNVIRFAAFENEEIQSPVFTKTYFIGNDFENRYEFPVVNITTDSSNLFGFEDGIYLPAKRFEENGFIYYPEGNYLNEGRDWERDAHISFFDKNKNLGFEEDIGIRMHGNGSASFPQKSFKIYFREEYGLNELDYPIFENSDNKKYKRLLFRNGGNDFLETHFKDALLQNIIGELDIDLQAFQPSIVFINGEYWGIHNIREKYDRFHFQYNYGIDKEAVNVLKVDGRVEEGDNEDYLELIDFVNQNDLSITSNFDYVKNRIDISNLIDFQIAEIYFANYDWPCNNFKIWKGNEPNSKWRYAIYDLDYTFGYDERSNFNVNSIEHATSEADSWPHCLISNAIFINLLKNESFKNQFIDQFYSCLKNTFRTTRIIDKIDNFQSLYQSEIQEHIDRWNYPKDLNAWKDQIQKLKEFATERPCYMTDHLVSFFNLTDFDFNCKEVEIEGSLTIYPNPSIGSFTISNKTFEKLENADLKIFNFNGQIVLSKNNISLDKNKKIEINANQLPFGVYFLILKNELQSIEERFIISSN